MTGAEYLQNSKREMLLLCRRCDDKSDLSGLCRICLTYLHPSEMKQIFSSKSTDSWQALIKSITDVEVNAGDGLPALVCCLCVSKLNHAKDFKEKCISSDNLLLNSLRQDDKNFNLPALPRVSKQQKGVADTSGLCRLCVTQFAPNDMTPIFHNNGLDSLPDKIASITSVKVAVGDGLPARICDCCVAKLLRASEFVEDSIAKDRYLRTELFQVKREVNDLEVPSDPLEPDWKPQVKQEPGESCQENGCAGINSNYMKNLGKKQEEADEWFIADAAETSLSALEDGVKVEPADAQELQDAAENMIPTAFTRSLMAKPVAGRDSEPGHGERCTSASEGPRAGSDLEASLDVQHKLRGPQKMSYQCDFCKKIYAKKLPFVRHVVTHSDSLSGLDEIFQCDFCAEKFSNRAGRSRHIRKAHADVKPIKCPVCEKRFKTSQQSKVHQVTHTTERPHKCEICGKSFKSKEARRVHVTTHLDAKRFACKICDRRFRTRHQVREHQAVHSEARPYACGRCERAFKTPVALSVHSKAHLAPPISCKECGKVLATAVSYRYHVQTHDGDRVRRFHCHICNGSFMAKCSLKKHLAAHAKTSVAGERRLIFKCKFCSSHFNERSDLKSHITCEHSKEPHTSCAASMAKEIQEGSMARKNQERPTGVEMQRRSMVRKIQKIFKCKLCPSHFTEKSDLKSHINFTHPKETQTKERSALSGKKCTSESLNWQRQDTSRPTQETNLTDANCSEKPLILKKETFTKTYGRPGRTGRR